MRSDKARVPNSLTAKIKSAKIQSETRILAGFANICTRENSMLFPIAGNWITATHGREKRREYLASFPGLPTVRFLIACSFCILQAIKNWTVGRPGNEAREYQQNDREQRQMMETRYLITLCVHFAAYNYCLFTPHKPTVCSLFFFFTYMPAHYTNTRFFFQFILWIPAYSLSHW